MTEMVSMCDVASNSLRLTFETKTIRSRSDVASGTPDLPYVRIDEAPDIGFVVCFFALFRQRLDDCVGLLVHLSQHSVAAKARENVAYPGYVAKCQTVIVTLTMESERVGTNSVLQRGGRVGCERMCDGIEVMKR